MSDREVDINLAKGDAKVKISEEDRIKQKKDRADIKARLAVVLERGIVNDRLFVALPPDVHGEWVPNNKEEIYRMEAMGFKIDLEYAKKRALHNDGTDASIVGDVIHMTCPRVVKEVIDEIRKEKFDAMHNPKKGKQKEEREFIESATAGLKDSHMHIDEEGSSVSSASREQILAALEGGKTDT